jgi:septal ring factor EnvC (AmiA/AmiB activator)
MANGFKLTAPLLVVLSAVCLSAQQADRARTEALARRADARLKALHTEADRLASQERTLLNELRQLDVQRQIKAEELAGIEREAAGVAADIQSTDARIADLEAADRAEGPVLRQRLVDMYKLGQGGYIRLLLSTDDVRRVGQASRLVGALAKIDTDRVAEYRRTIADLRSSRTALADRKKELERLRGETTRAQAALAQSAEARATLARRIDQERDLNARFTGELRAAQDRLRQTLADLARGAPTVASALPLDPFKGDLPWPAKGTVNRRAGRTAVRGGAASSGVEILVDEGTEVRAVHDGVVAFAGSFSGFGNLVILDHGSRSFSLYGDLRTLDVQAGAHVDRGTVLGDTGTLPAGPAGLYFELRIDGDPVDPLQWLVP